MINFFLKHIWLKIWIRLSWSMGLWILPFLFMYSESQEIRDFLGFIYISVIILMCIFNDGVEDIV